MVAENLNLKEWARLLSKAILAHLLIGQSQSINTGPINQSMNAQVL